MKITFFAGLRHRLFNMLPYLAVSLLIWTVCVLSSFGGERETFFSVFTEAVGGVEHSGQFDLFGFFRYFGTFFAGLFLGMAGSVLDSETMPYFVLPRSKSFFKWWIKTVSSALLWCVLYCLIGIAVCAAAAEKVGTLSAFELMRIAAYPLALGAAMCVLCLLRFLLGQKPAAAIVIAVVGTTGLICGKLKKLQLRHARRIRHGKTADRCQNGCGGTLCRRGGDDPCLFLLRRSEEKGFERRKLF